MDSLVEIASGWLGFPAVSYNGPDAGDSPTGFDCSGFVKYCLQQAAYFLPLSPTTGKLIRHTEELFDFYGILIHDEFKKPGDLVFFSKDFIKPTHVGIYVGSNQMIHSPGIDGEVIEVITIDYLQGRKIKLDGKPKQIYSNNPIGFKRPVKIINGKRYQRF